MDHPGLLGAEALKHPSQRFHEVAFEDAEQLALGAGRVGQGAQQVEEGAHAQLFARRARVPHGTM